MDEIPRVFLDSPPLGDVPPGRAEPLYAADVTDVHVAVSVNCDSCRPPELARLRSEATPLGDVPPRRAELLYPVVVPVGHVDVAASVNGDPTGEPELARTRSGTAPLRDEGRRWFARLGGGWISRHKDSRHQ